MPIEDLMAYIAHKRESDGACQCVESHLREAGENALLLTSKLGVPDAGRLLGILHDLGKYSSAFQRYIQSATGEINPDEDAYVDFKGLRGKIDHSSAGAQWIWDYCKKLNRPGQLVGQVLSLCIASHHSGLIDCLQPDGDDGFLKRINKGDEKTHKIECLANAEDSYGKVLESILDDELIKSIFNQLQNLSRNKDEPLPKTIAFFNLGLWTRMLFSCLIDADRINSADFEYPENSIHRNNVPPDWSIPISRFEQALDAFEGKKPIDQLRGAISNTCKTRAKDPQGIFSLTVPTGGGKTYASLRYAMHHARHHKLDRIIYIIPFTSIIEQNAQEIRKVLECPNDKFPWVLEQHSNLEPEHQTWHSKLVGENWDSPIVMTTMVQFLEVLFSGGTRGTRKLHQLANSVLIFDEIQTLPIKCTHLFCNAITFLTNYCNTSSMLCTATQPLLDQLKSPEKGQLIIPPENELVSDVPKLFNELKRVDISNKVKPKGWSLEEITNLAMTEFDDQGSCLVIVNTKAWAQQLFQTLKPKVDSDAIYQLSTNLCPSHRKAILSLVSQRLDKELPVLCVSTQLIEAGVNIDFASVVRFLAGLDSIAQAAGRCNRHALREKATVHVINPAQENIDLLPDIKVGRDKALRVLDEGFPELLAPDAISQYFKYYFYDRADEMTYPVMDKHSGLQDNLLNLLSDNKMNIGKNNNPHLLKQSFMTAGKAFKAIDSPTQAVIVPFGEEGKELIAELCSVAHSFDVKHYRQLLRQAQKYSVNVFPNVWKQLQAADAVHEIQTGEGIYYLEELHYSDDFGLTIEPTGPMPFLNI